MPRGSVCVWWGNDPARRPLKGPFLPGRCIFLGPRGKGDLVLAVLLTKEEGKCCASQAEREVSSIMNVEENTHPLSRGRCGPFGQDSSVTHYDYIAASCNHVVLGITKNAQQISRHPPGDSAPPTFCREDIELPQTHLAGRDHDQPRALFITIFLCS